MFGLLSRTRYGPVGLDVGTDGVRMLQLGRTRDRPFVASAAQWRFPEVACGPQADSTIQSRRVGIGEIDVSQSRCRLAAEGVRKMLKSGRFRGRDVVSCLRADEIGIKNIRLPRMPEKELPGAVMRECRERFGFDVTPDRVHYINAGEVRRESEPGSEFVLMAVPEDGIRRHLEMLSEMRLRPIHIDAEPAALFRTYRRFLRRADDASTVTVIADIGLACTKVVVARGSTILLVKTITIAGRQFNESVARELNISYSDAAHLRSGISDGRSSRPGRQDRTGPPAGDNPAQRDSRPDPSESVSRPPDVAGGTSAGRSGALPEQQVEWTVFDAVREQVEALAREISLCLRYCSVTFRGLRADRIILTGAEAYDRRLVRSLNEYINCKCVTGCPLRGIDLSEADLGGDRRGELTEWSVAVGLALRGLDGLAEIASTRPAASGRRGHSAGGYAGFITGRFNRNRLRLCG